MPLVLSMALVHCLGQTSAQLHSAQHHNTRVLTDDKCSSVLLPAAAKAGLFRSSMLKGHRSPAAVHAQQSSAGPRHAPAPSALWHRKGRCSLTFPWRFSQCLINAFHLGPPSQKKTHPHSYSCWRTKIFSYQSVWQPLRQLEHSWSASLPCTRSLLQWRFILSIEPTETHLWLCLLLL